MQIESNFTKMEPANQRETAAQNFLRLGTSTGWDPEGEDWPEGSQGPVPLGSWDLPCHLPPWRPAGPEGGKEQCWALCSGERGLKPISLASRLFSQIPLGYSCSQPALPYPLERAAQLSEPRSPQLTLPRVTSFCFHHMFSSGRPGEDPSGTRMWILLETSHVLGQIDPRFSEPMRRG